MRAVTLDLWHTLVRLSPEAEDRYIERHLAALTELVRSSRPLPHLGRAVVEPEAAARRALTEAFGRTGRGARLANLAVEAAAFAGREPDPAGWVASAEALLAEQPFEVISGADEQLRWLKEEGYRTAIVSNLIGETGRSMRKVLERLDLARLIDAVAFSEELPWAKPAPEIFWRALEPLGARATDAVHIGDSASDVLGARAAGFLGSVLFVGAHDYSPLYAAWNATKTPIRPPPTHRMGSWSQLPAILDELYDPRGRR